MAWYMMKTWAGREEALAREIRRTVPPYLYDEAFVIYNERNMRHQGKSVIRVEPLFSGKVFLTTRGETEGLSGRLERVPSVACLLRAGAVSLYPLQEKDAAFLEMLSGKSRMVRASYVLRESEDGNIYRISGALEHLSGNIEKIRFSSRIAKTHRRLWGEETVIPLGILVNEDMGGNVVYENRETREALWGIPDHYSLLEIRRDARGKNVYVPGGQIVSCTGTDQQNAMVS